MMLSKYVVDAQYRLANDNSDFGPHRNGAEGWWLKGETGQQQRKMTISLLIQ